MRSNCCVFQEHKVNENAIDVPCGWMWQHYVAIRWFARYKGHALKSLYPCRLSDYLCFDTFVQLLTKHMTIDLINCELQWLQNLTFLLCFVWWHFALNISFISCHLPWLVVRFRFIWCIDAIYNLHWNSNGMCLRHFPSCTSRVCVIYLLDWCIW